MFLIEEYGAERMKTKEDRKYLNRRLFAFCLFLIRNFSALSVYRVGSLVPR